MLLLLLLLLGFRGYRVQAHLLLLLALLLRHALALVGSQHVGGTCALVGVRAVGDQVLQSRDLLLLLRLVQHVWGSE